MLEHNEKIKNTCCCQGYEDMYTRIKRTRRTAQRQLPRGKKLTGSMFIFDINMLLFYMTKDVFLYYF